MEDSTYIYIWIWTLLTSMFSCTKLQIDNLPKPDLGDESYLILFNVFFFFGFLVPPSEWGGFF